MDRKPFRADQLTYDQRLDVEHCVRFHVEKAGEEVFRHLIRMWQVTPEDSDALCYGIMERLLRSRSDEKEEG
jgi:hypothetical protein